MLNEVLCLCCRVLVGFLSCFCNCLNEVCLCLCIRVLGNVMLNFKLFVEGCLVVLCIFVFICRVLLIDVDDIIREILDKVIGDFELWNVDFLYLFCRDVFIF